MDITVILPVHKYDDIVEKAIDSFKTASDGTDVKLLVVTTKELSEKFNGVDCHVITTEESEPTTFSHLVNKGVSSVETEFFSILEMDDEYTKNVFRNFELYRNSGIEASAYIPLTKIIDAKNHLEVGYINEFVLAPASTEELGYFDIDSMIDLPNFNYTGGIFNKKDFVEVGGLKESMRVHFWHELVLRMMHNGKRLYVIPKVGYKHMVNREGSYYDELNKVITDKELDFWLDTAKKEYFYKKDREKTYEE